MAEQHAAGRGGHTEGGAGEPSFAGLEGGGTRTLCLVYARRTGALGMGRGGPVNPNFVPPEAARAAILEALTGALHAAGIGPGGLRCAAVAAPWAEDLARAVVSDLAPGASVISPGEDLTALLGGALRDHGLVLIAGTGSRCAYLPPGGGAPVVSGAWGSLFGDEGSGYDLGRRALQAVTRAWDGRGPETLLAEMVAGAWGLKEPKDLVRAVYRDRRGGWREQIASLCPLVGRAAAAGDRVALEILHAAAGELALLVEAVVARARLGRPAELLLSGGVFGLGDQILRPLERRLAESGAATVIRPLLPPVYGALFAAMRAGGEAPCPELVARLQDHHRQWDLARKRVIMGGEVSPGE